MSPRCVRNEGYFLSVLFADGLVLTTSEAAFLTLNIIVTDKIKTMAHSGKENNNNSSDKPLWSNLQPLAVISRINTHRNHNKINKY